MLNFRKLIATGLQPIDNSTCLLFRVFFGYFIAQWAWDYLENGIVTRTYVLAKYHFTYPGLDWVRPLPGSTMYLLFVAFVILGIAIAIGFQYRMASLLFAMGFTYFFALERTNYQNHYYLICLMAWWMPFLPLHRDLSVDAWRKRQPVDRTIPRWVLWTLRFHLGIPYFFGGIAKLNADWLQGQPLTQMLMSRQDLPYLGEVFSFATTGLVLSWGGLLFDLFIVPALMWRKSRALACVLTIVFHLMNSVVFNIHIFPWLMLASTPIFFEPDWPRRFISRGQPSTLGSDPPRATENGDRSITSKHKVVAILLGIYVAFHLAWPLRHLGYQGNTSWTERGHYFAWRMMLRGKKAVLGYAIKDHVTGKVVDGRVSDFLTLEQSEKFGRDPEMILAFGHFLGAEYRRRTGRESSVYVLALVSLNGRKPELLIDPNRDLLTIQRESSDRSWVLPQTEPLRFPAWDLPAQEWRNHVKLPTLEFMNSKP